jgi:hypothetical protein
MVETYVNDVLVHAADIIETRGLARTVFWDSEGRVCAAQALWLAIAGPDAEQTLPGMTRPVGATDEVFRRNCVRYNAARYELLDRTWAGSVATWSDHATVEEVLRVLRGET